MDNADVDRAIDNIRRVYIDITHQLQEVGRLADQLYFCGPAQCPALRAAAARFQAGLGELAAMYNELSAWASRITE